MSYTKRVLEQHYINTNTLKDEILQLKVKLQKLEDIVKDMIIERESN